MKNKINKDILNKKDGFTGRLGFILACVGSSVGMGNIWRFPVMISMWGGLSFLIPYILFVILIASTGVIGEFALGRHFKSGPVGAFAGASKPYGREKLGKRLGIIPILGSFALAVGYTCVMGWIFKYSFLAISGDLFSMGTNLDLIGASFEATASSFANNFWIVVAIIVSIFIMSMGIAGGIEKVNKVLMPLLFIMLVGLGIYIGQNPAARDGYRYIFSLDTDNFFDIKLWIFAFGQAFFSLSIAGNGSVIYGSYLPDSEDIPKSAKNIAFFDSLAALLASLVIIPAIALAHGNLDTGGPGLMFIYLVNVFNQMEGGAIVMAIFYLAVLFAGISSIINLYEAPVAYIKERFSLKRSLASIIINTLGLFVALLIQGIVGQWMDFVSIVIAPLGALLAGIMFYWVLDKNKALGEINKGRDKSISPRFYSLGKYVYCSLTIIALVAGLILGGIG